MGGVWDGARGSPAPIRLGAAVFSGDRIPIAGTRYRDGDKTYLDFAPGSAGTPGQLIALVTECDFTVLGAGFSDVLERYLVLLESGRLIAREGRIVPAEGRWAHAADWLAERFAELTAPTIPRG